MQEKVRMRRGEMERTPEQCETGYRVEQEDSTANMDRDNALGA